MTKVSVKDETTGEVELVEDNSLQIDSAHIKVTPYAIEFDGNPSLEEWYTALQKVNRVNSMTQFYLGDLVVYAESPMTGWGETYKELMENTGYAYDTLAKYAMVARRFTPNMRESIFAAGGKNTNLSFEHFKEATSLDDEHAIYFLKMVADGGWTRDRIRDEKYRLSHGGTTVREEPEVEVLPDGWEEVKNTRLVPAPEYAFGDDSYSEKDHRTVAIQLYKYEIEELLEVLEDNDNFLSLVDRLNRALGGL